MAGQELGPTACWQLLGEGNANAVFGYRGQDPALHGWVLRVDKGKTFLPDAAELVQPLSKMERDVWAVYPDVANAPDEVHRRAAYVDQVITPLLGSQYLPKQVLHCADSAWLCELLTQSKKPGPLAATDGQKTVALQADNTSLPGSYGTTVCIEIKPKSGVKPGPGALLHPQHNGVKQNHHRYHLHQHLKVAQGKTSQISAYCPSDLLSGDPNRILQALNALWSDPQNNLKAFVNGEKVSLNEDGKREIARQLGQSASDISSAGPTSVCALLCDILAQEECLQRLVKAQAIDELLIEGCYVIWCKLLLQQYGVRNLPEQLPEPPEPVPVEADSNAPSQTASSANSISIAQYNKRLAELQAPDAKTALDLLQKYLIASTLKDCGLMITLAKGGSNSNCTGSSAVAVQGDVQQNGVHSRRMADSADGVGLFVDNGGSVWKYKVAFVDLDVKPVGKLPQHYTLDQQIAQHAASIGV